MTRRPFFSARSAPDICLRDRMFRPATFPAPPEPSPVCRYRLLRARICGRPAGDRAAGCEQPASQNTLASSDSAFYDGHRTRMMHLVPSTEHHIVPLFIIFHARYAPNEYGMPFVAISALSVCCLPPGRFRRIPVFDRIRSMKRQPAANRLIWTGAFHGCNI